MRLRGETEKEEERQAQQTKGLLTRTRTQLHIGYTSGAKWFPCALNIMASRYFVSKANDKSQRKNPAPGGKESTFPTSSIRVYQILFLASRLEPQVSRRIRLHNYESVKIPGTIEKRFVPIIFFTSNVRVCNARSGAHASARSGFLMDKRSKPRLH